MLFRKNFLYAVGKILSKLAYNRGDIPSVFILFRLHGTDRETFFGIIVISKFLVTKSVPISHTWDGILRMLSHDYQNEIHRRCSRFEMILS